MGIRKLLRPFIRIPGSIKKTLQLSYVLIIILMLVPTVYSITVSRLHTTQYDGIITNVSRANKLNMIVKVEITDEIWNIVAGIIKFQNGKQYIILRKIKNGIEDMMNSTQNELNRQKLEVASRAVQTLQRYIDVLGYQIQEDYPVSENEKILEEIRGCAALIYDILQDFIVSEIETAERTNESIKKSSINLSLIQVLITFLVIAVAVYALTSVSQNIRRPINDMEILSSDIASGNFETRIKDPDVAELNNLAKNLNTMAGKIQSLINQNIQEQKNLQKAEMKALQAQITPHFLYNTFDTIIWLAESNKNDQVIEITRAFSDFFRISLSKGHEWITVKQELDHVKNYLKIQKIRYRDILDYSFETAEEIENYPILKLILQPLVENAIYHGIKNKRGRGHLKITAVKTQKDSKDFLFFSITDDGIGFTPERLLEVQTVLNEGHLENSHSVYGMYNVNKRLKLYYDNSVNLEIKSEYKKGTCISFYLPNKNPW